MSIKKVLLTIAVLVAAVVVLSACAGPEGPAGPAGPEGPAGSVGPMPSAAELTCTQCHNDTTLIVSKEAQFRERSVHGTGEAFERGEGTNCAGCHGTEGAKARINAGLLPHDASIEGVVNVSPYDCRTCHNIHTTYTLDDFSLTGGEQPVVMERTTSTYDGGAGNLCANCHQFRNAAPTVDAGNISVTSSHFGPHLSAQAQMLLGEGGLGGVTGTPSPHYSTVTDTCVACHMGAEFNHTYAPEVERCVACHADLEDFDNNGAQTEIATLLEELKAQFIAKGMMDEEEAWIASSSAPAIYPEAIADAMWNYSFVAEDGSLGVHNSAYAKALLQQALDALK